MRYVERNKDGNVVGHFACPQPGYAEEAVPDDSPELLAYRAAKAARPARKIRTPAEKLARIGLTVDELKALLAT